MLTLLGSLNPVDDDWLAWGRAAFAGFSTLPGPRTALLVGGPTPLAPWDETAMVGVFQALAEQIRSEGGSLLATTSRRTPPALAEILRAKFADLPHVIWGDGGDGTNPYGGLLGWANRVVVSPDSVNLLSEACATRMPVMVALADTAQGRLARFQQQLRERGRLQPHWLDWQYDRIEPLRETARVAAEVKQRLAWGSAGRWPAMRIAEHPADAGQRPALPGCAAISEHFNPPIPLESGVPIGPNAFMRTLLLLPLALLAACSTAPTELDPISINASSSWMRTANSRRCAIRRRASARRCRSPRSAMPATGNSSARAWIARCAEQRMIGARACPPLKVPTWIVFPACAAPLLIASLLATAPAWADSTACRERYPSVASQAAMLDVAWTTAERLDALPDVDVVVAARGGQDLSRYGLRHSHLAFLLREDDDRWRAMHLLNRCKTDRSQLYHEGLGNFVGERRPYRPAHRRAVGPCGAARDAGVALDPAQGAARSEVQRGRLPVRHRLPELQPVGAGSAGGGDGAGRRRAGHRQREQAQQWLRQQKYQPSVLHIGLGKRVGARLFVANATTTDHPAGERISGNYAVVTVESVFDFLHQRSQLQQELVIPTCRWPVPLPPRPESRKENHMRPLLTSVLSMVIVTGLAWSTAAHAERRIVIIHDPGPQGPSLEMSTQMVASARAAAAKEAQDAADAGRRWPARSRSSCRRWR